MKIPTIIIFLVIFLSINFLVRKMLDRLNNESNLLKNFRRFFPIIELIAWALFIIWVSNTLFESSKFHLYVNTLIITLGFVLVYWFFIKDYISGVQIKSRFNPSHGQFFKSDQTRGVVKKLGTLVMEVKSENGSDFKIPYSKIDQKSIELNIQEKSGGESTFTIELDKDVDETDACQKLTELILNSPWSSYKSTPDIKVVDDKNNLKTYEISFVSNGKNSSRQLRELIEKEIRQLK